ncbi:MAG: hypothetical protein K2Z80_27190 [Xanthobacteraceae bacterium]|nr:hypothetical protein [Xanthobacteraceae bacterium]
MSAPDWFLVAWWLLVSAISVLVFIRGRRSNALHAQRAALSYLNKGRFGRYPASQGSQNPTLIEMAVVALILLLLAGWVVLLICWDWTRLSVLNGQMFAILLGALVAWVGLSAKAFAKTHIGGQPRKMPGLVRAGFALVGLAIVMGFGIIAIRDIVLPRRVVEGHVDRAYKSGGYGLDSEYVVVIDGKRFRSTFETFEHIRPAQRVRAEVGAGSGMIFAAEERRAAGSGRD